MIISKTPLRMSFVGGGSDLPSFYSEEMGAVLSTSIDKYMYVCVNRKFDRSIRVSYSRTENVQHRQELVHPLVREALELLDIDGGIEIASMSDIPSNGTGLGSSSAFTVGLINALYAFKDQFASKEKLASLASEIEINRCGEPIGKQDQYAAAYGGLNLIRFHPDNSVSVDPVICNPSLIKRMEESILIFYTNRTRSASEVLAAQSDSIRYGDQRPLVRRMAQMAFEMKEQLEAGCLDNFGDLLNENWCLKAQLTKGISDTQIDAWYAAGKAGGALGGKLLGAGKGGFMMFFAPKSRHAKIMAALTELETVKFRFDRTGSQIVFYQPSL